MTIRHLTEEEKERVLKDLEAPKEESEEDKALSLKLLQEAALKKQLGIVTNASAEEKEMKQKILFEELEEEGEEI